MHGQAELAHGTRRIDCGGCVMRDTQVCQGCYSLEALDAGRKLSAIGHQASAFRHVKADLWELGGEELFGCAAGIEKRGICC